MNHDAIHPLLDDYVDGTLAPDRAAAVESHLEACADCRAEVTDTRSLLSAAAKLPRSIEPPNDLWSGIANQIDERPSVLANSLGQRARTLWTMRYPLAAAAILLIVTSSAVTALLLRDRSASDVPVPATADLRPERLPLVSSWRSTEGEYLRATLELAEALEAAKDRLTPEMVALIENNLRIIDSAIQESRAALALEPTNLELIEVLMSRYEKKLEVLRGVNRMSADL